MYDIGREIHVGLCSFYKNQLCYYLPQSQSIKTVQKKSNHYENTNQIVDLIQSVARQLFYYSNSLQKINSKQEEFQVKNILIENIKKITVYNCDKHGLIPQQKIFFLFSSFLHSKINKLKSLREQLNQVHYVLTSNQWTNSQQQLPYTLSMLLNGQFQELLSYAKDQLFINCSPKFIQNLVDALVHKIEQKQNEQKNLPIKKMSQKLLKTIDQNSPLKKLLNESKQKNRNIFQLFQTKYHIEILLAILVGDLQVIEEVSKGSWGIYLNLYTSFISQNKQPNLTYENIVKSYFTKYFSNGKNKKSLSQNQEFLLKIINSTDSTNRFSFHEIYQSTFNIFSPVLCHLIGLLLIECQMIDLFSIFNSQQYEQEIILNLLSACSQTSWTSLVYFMGFIQNTGFIKDSNAKQTLWESLLISSLPYQLDSANLIHGLHIQVKQIEQKLEDLNLIGLSYITKSYLNKFLQLQMKQSNSNGKLNESILQLFFLNLEFTDSSNVNQCFHLIKVFLTNYYKNWSFNYKILEYLQSIFQRKQKLLSDKLANKIQKLFSWIYKVKRIYEIEQIETETEEQNRQNLLRQMIEYNKLFSSNKKNKSPLLCVDLLKLGSYLNKKAQAYFGQLSYQFGDKSDQKQQKILKQFKNYLTQYTKQWKASLQKTENWIDSFNQQTKPMQNQILQQLIYFQKNLY